MILPAPVLRLLLPMMVGIAVCSWIGEVPLWVAMALASLAVYIVLRVASRTPARRQAMRHWWWIPLGAMAMSLGMATAILHSPPQLNLQEANGRVAVLHIEQVTRKDFSMSISARIERIEGLALRNHPVVMVSTRGCDYTLHPGHTMLATLALEPITNLGNPDEPDYANQMLRQGLRYRMHVPLTELRVLEENAPSWRERAARWRWQVEERVMNTHTSPLTQQLVSAMLLGDSRMIDDELRDEFSHAGVTHILALSGLHVGVIAWIVWLLLFPLDYMGLKRVRLLLTLGVVAAFAVFTGLSPSVVRATLMISAAFASEVAYRRSHPLNALALAALLILLFAPSQLFGAGFQLSFITVGALLLATQRVTRRNGIVGAVKSVLVATTVATLATTMISAYYFHTVPLLTLVSNLLALPLVPVAIAAGALLVACSAAGFELAMVNSAADVVCRLLAWVARQLGNVPFSHLDGLYVSTGTTVLYALALALLGWWLARRNRWLLAGVLVATVGMAVSMVLTRWQSPSSGVVVFNDFKHLPVVAYAQGQGVLWMPDGDDDAAYLVEDFTRKHRAFLSRRHIVELSCVVGGDTTLPCGIAVRAPYAIAGGKSLLALQRKTWRQLAADSLRVPADVLLLTRSYGGSTRLATSAFHSRLVVAATRLPADSLATLPCPVHTLVTQGAWAEEH